MPKAQCPDLLRVTGHARKVTQQLPFAELLSQGDTDACRSLGGGGSRICDYLKIALANIGLFQVMGEK